MNHILIIAEAGVNHNGSLHRAKELIKAAAAAGADIVKFQTARTEKVMSKFAAKADYQLAFTDQSETQLEMCKKFEFDEAAHDALFACCQDNDIQFLSTPFDTMSVELLQKYELPFFKIPSGEITHAPLLLKIARLGKPIVLSTGMAALSEIEYALSVIAFGYLNADCIKPSHEDFFAAYRSAAGRRLLQQQVTLLHCTTEYPAPYEEVNLKAMDVMHQAFQLRVGYSDHTRGIEAAIAAAARGALIIEKHFTLDRRLPGPDHQASLEPDELQSMVKAIRHVEQMLGEPYKMPSASEMKNRSIARKSLIAATAIKKGEPFSEVNLAIKRPGNGISPHHYWEWLDKIASRDYEEDELITIE